MDKYNNILEKHKNVSNDLPWVTRPITFTKAYQQQKPVISPEHLKLLVYHNYELNDILSKLSSEPNSDNYVEHLWKTIEEIGFSYDIAVVRWLSLFLIKILKRSLNAIFVNEEKLLKIKSEIGSSPVIFVPTHRSYADFVIMAFVTFDYDIHIPCVAAGMDFLSMKIMNKLLRKSKAFFMRRKFTNDVFYKTIFQEYIRTLVTFEESPIEFYIEGTRSRTGKTLTPKLGLLSMLIDAYISGEVPDLTFVPVSINYDKILEESLFSYELLGVPKPKESTRGFFKALKVLNQNYGNIYITFGQPFSVRNYLDNNINFITRSSYNECHQIRQIAYNIINEQQKGQTFGIFNLLALVLHNNLMEFGSYKIKLKVAIQNIEWLIFIFDLFKIRFHLDGPLESVIYDCINIHSSIIELRGTDEISIVQWNETGTKEGMNGTIKILLNNRLPSIAIPIISLQLYVNPILCYFIKSSLILTILNNISFNDLFLKKAILFKNYDLFIHLLKNEFVFNIENELNEFSETLNHLDELHVIQINDDDIRLLKDKSEIKFFNLLVEPFLTSYYYILKFLMQSNMHNEKVNDLIQRIQKFMEEKLLTLEILHYYCLSRDLISNALYSLIEMNVLVKHKVLNDYFYDVNNVNLSALLKFIEPYVNKRINCNNSHNRILVEKAKL